MTGYLDALVDRTLGTRGTVRPRLSSIFERSPFGSGAADPARASVEGLEVEASAVVLSGPAEAPARPTDHGTRDPAPPARTAESSPKPQRRPITDSDAGPAPPRAAGAEPRARAAGQLVEISRARAPTSSHPAAEARSAPEGQPRRETAGVPVVEPQTVPGGPAAPARAEAIPSALSAPRLVETRVVGPRPEVRRAALEREPSAETRSETAGREAGATDEPDREPVVHVHIGRIEVRAPAKQEPPPRPPRLREPLLSLDDYLEESVRRHR